MRVDIFWALTVFCFVGAITPGPNNLMLMASGLNFGVRRTLPHLMGVVLGFTFMILVVGAGLGAIFTQLPFLLPVLRYVGAAYMLWLAWRIAFSGPLSEAASGRRPLGFFGAAGFQWVNPKAWVLAIGALTAYPVSDSYAQTVLVVTAVDAVVGLPGSGFWALFGASMRRFLGNPRILRAFNVAMALLLAASVVPVLMEG